MVNDWRVPFKELILGFIGGLFCLFLVVKVAESDEPDEKAGTGYRVRLVRKLRTYL